MRYFTHRNKAGRDLLVASPAYASENPIACYRIRWEDYKEKKWVLDYDSYLGLRPANGVSGYYEVGSGKPGRHWVEVDAVKAMAILVR